MAILPRVMAFGLVIHLMALPGLSRTTSAASVPTVSIDSQSDNQSVPAPLGTEVQCQPARSGARGASFHDCITLFERFQEGHDQYDYRFLHLQGETVSDVIEVPYVRTYQDCLIEIDTPDDWDAPVLTARVSNTIMNVIITCFINSDRASASGRTNIAGTTVTVKLAQSILGVDSDSTIGSDAPSNGSSLESIANITELSQGKVTSKNNSAATS